MEKNRSKYLEAIAFAEKKREEENRKHLKELLIKFYDDSIEASNRGKYDNRIGLRIGAICEIRKLSFAELGRMAGVDKSTVSRVVQKGTIPTQENFIKIIDALQIDIENFVDIPEETDAWVNNEKSIANGVYDLLEDVVPIYDIDILKNNIFLMLEDDIFTYTKNGEKHQLTAKHLDILRKHILLSFDTLDAILEKE